MLMSSGNPSRLVSDRFSAEHSSASYDASARSDRQEQREAAAALIDHNNGDIFAWLKLARSARSIEPIPQQRSRNPHLSPLQIHALFVLKDCPNDKILSCLELARLCRDESTAVKLWTDPAETGTFQPDVGPPSRQFATGRSVKSTRSKNAESHYWCTVCEEPNSYKDSGTWKKHEKEHETVFVCGLEHTAGQSHASKVFTCKRRDIMVNHLNKSHGAIEAHRGRELAEEWRHTVKKQAWSCGFCITPFLTFQDRLKHVDIEHFRRHQSIHEWDLNKVILGLLQQPKMEKAWKTRAASLTPWVQPEGFAWDKAIAKDLRARLEIGPSDDQDANALADEAYSASKANEGSWAQSSTNHANLYPNATAQASFLSSQRQYETISTPMSDSGLYHRPSPAIRDSAAHLSSDSLFVGAPTSTFALNKMTQPAMPSFDDDDDGLVGHNASLFSSSQTWTSTPETGNFFSGHEQSNDYGGHGGLGGEWSTPNWK